MYTDDAASNVVKLDLSKIIDLCTQLDEELKKVMDGEHACAEYHVNDAEYEILDNVILNLEEILECND